MKRTFLVLLVVMMLAVSAGCASRSAAATKSRTFNATTVTVTGTVTAVNVTTSPAASQGSKSGSGNPVPTGMDEINVKETSGTIAMVNLGRDTKDISVKVGDTVTVTGFEMSKSANTIMARTFEGADGKTVTIANAGMRGGSGGNRNNIPANPSNNG
ncbi:hypothetical protein [Candidatus Cryosericum odellii]|jgi:hypothetical protein|uniref:DUF5666 domain-containing protein n=1 Tax=Candidatus Cryosericum odellii TaxID=2290917 RepID=A0A398CXE6_9BACT|nr:hypothetical protein [Candidatus Cryosericum odellii]RIE06900.1 hypothetical protein SMC6_08100 [Candidatus Cryosericum odellii]RIE07614.1 hypothetical protein SMC5_09245 [Candidatus Cryosericum odellii]